MRGLAQALIARAHGAQSSYAVRLREGNPPLAPSFLNVEFRNKHASAYASSRLQARKRKRRHAYVAAACYLAGLANIVIGCCIIAGAPTHNVARIGLCVAIAGALAFLLPPSSN